MRQGIELRASGDEKVYEFSVSIQSGRYHLLEWRQKLVVQMLALTTHQEVSQFFTPTQLVETGNETLFRQWGLLRTRNGEGHWDGLYEGLD